MYVCMYELSRVKSLHNQLSAVFCKNSHDYISSQVTTAIVINKTNTHHEVFSCSFSCYNSVCSSSL